MKIGVSDELLTVEGSGEVTGEPTEEKVFAWATRIHVENKIGEWVFTLGDRPPTFSVPESVSYSVEQVPLVAAVGARWIAMEAAV